MNAAAQPRALPRWPWLVALALAAFKLWLVAEQRFDLKAPATHDAELFLRLAQHLLAGDWLGPYDRLTLVKGPGYPLFIAASNLLGVPLPFARQLLHALACLALAGALRPLVRQPVVWLLLVAGLLLNPLSFAPGQLRISREGLYVALTLFSLAGLVGAYVHRLGTRRALGGWSVLAGLAFGLFWITREEGLWLLPAFAGLLGLAAWSCLRAEGRRALPRLGLLALAPALWLAVVGVVVQLNASHYGARVLTEMRGPDFAAGLAALQGAAPENRRQFVPVPRATREALYAVSPSLARLREHLDGDTCAPYVGVSQIHLGMRPDEADIAGGWFLWALREAAEQVGVHDSAKEAAVFYRQVAEEVAAAQADGRVTGRPGPGLAPPWHPSYGPALLHRVVEGLRFVTTYDLVTADRLRVSSDVPDGWRQEIEALIGSPLWVDPDGAAVARPASTVRTRLQQTITRAVRASGPALSVAALAAWLLTTLGVLRRRRRPDLWFVTTAVLAVYLLRTLLLAYIDVTSYKALTMTYFTPNYALVPLLQVLAIYDLFTSRRPAPDAAPRARRADRGVSGVLVRFALFLLVTALLVEGGWRLLGSPAEALLRNPYLLRPDPTLGWAAEPGGWEQEVDGAPVPLNIGRQGFRDTLTPASGLGAAAVLALGGDLVLGRGVREADLFTRHLEEQTNLRVFNRAVAGYSLDQQLLLWRRLGPSLSPRLVLATVCRDDVRNVTRDRVAGRAKPRFDDPSGSLDRPANLPLVEGPLLRASHVARAVAARQEPRPWQPEVGEELVRRLVTTLDEEVGEAGAKLLVLSWEPEVTEWLAPALDEADVWHLDLAPTLAPVVGPDEPGPEGVDPALGWLAAALADEGVEFEDTSWVPRRIAVEAARVSPWRELPAADDGDPQATTRVWNEHGHRLVAKAIIDHLVRIGWPNRLVTRAGHWRDPGGASRGALGFPRLIVQGSGMPGARGLVQLNRAPPDAVVALLVSIASEPQAAHGGVFHAVPTARKLVVRADELGRVLARFTWPRFRPGTTLVFQAMVHDPTARGGLKRTLTNAPTITVR